jgi:hypothetical protein
VILSFVYMQTMNHSHSTTQHIDARHRGDRDLPLWRDANRFLVGVELAENCLNAAIIYAYLSGSKAGLSQHTIPHLRCPPCGKPYQLLPHFNPPYCE